MGTPNWQNQTIWTGDNLEILRGMNSESVDLIYLDPPFNSKKNYAAPIGSQAAGAAFKDTWTLSDVDEAWHGEIAERAPVLYSIIDAAGQAHGKGMKSYLIMMAVRLLELRRVLKDSGSLYLHCDPTASHYLKTLLDAIFTVKNYRNEISWKRTTTKNDYKQGATNWPRVRDVVLYYSKNSDLTQYAQLFKPNSDDYIQKFYRHVEPKTGRRYQLGDLAAPGAGTRGHPQYTFLGVTRYWRYNEVRMNELLKDGRIVQTKPGAVPRFKRYLDEMPGIAVGDDWDDIGLVQGQSKERTGYPTQKPLALLERIILASSNYGDVVLDPFCGCATTCIAAEKNERQWVGIDISPKALDLVNLRLRKELGIFGRVKTEGVDSTGSVIHRTDIPRRTEDGPIPSYKTHKHTLFGRQEGVCNGCRQFFQFRNFTIDHIVPQAKGGTDHLDNLQLLCGACNSMKGKGTQEQLIARLNRKAFDNEEAC